MIKKALSLLRSKKSTSKVYSEVLTNEDTSAVADLLKIAAKRANQDQQKLIKS